VEVLLVDPVLFSYMSLIKSYQSAYSPELDIVVCGLLPEHALD